MGKGGSKKPSKKRIKRHFKNLILQVIAPKRKQFKKTKKRIKNKENKIKKPEQINFKIFLGLKKKKNFLILFQIQD